MRVWAGARVFISVCVFGHVRVRVCMCVCVYECVCVCERTYVHLDARVPQVDAKLSALVHFDARHYKCAHTRDTHGHTHAPTRNSLVRLSAARHILRTHRPTNAHAGCLAHSYASAHTDTHGTLMYTTDTIARTHPHIHQTPTARAFITALIRRYAHLHSVALTRKCAWTRGCDPKELGVHRTMATGSQNPTAHSRRLTATAS